MPRQKLIRSSESLYHLYSRCNNKDWFSLPMDQVYGIISGHLNLVSGRYGVLVHALVLMANHFHLLVSTPKMNLDDFMRDLVSKTSRSIGRASRRINHVFGGRYRWTILYDAYAVAYVYKYIIRNPVRADISRRAEDYPYSSLTNLINGDNHLSIVEPYSNLWSLVPPPLDERLVWLNEPTPKEAEKLIENALRRFEFSFSRGHSDQKLLKLLRAKYGIERPYGVPVSEHQIPEKLSDTSLPAVEFVDEGAVLLGNDFAL